MSLREATPRKNGFAPDLTEEQEERFELERMKQWQDDAWEKWSKDEEVMFEAIGHEGMSLRMENIRIKTIVSLINANKMSQLGSLIANQMKNYAYECEEVNQ